MLILFLPFVLLFSNSITLVIINIILSGFSTLKLHHDFEIYYLLLLCVHVHKLFQGCMPQCLYADQRTTFWSWFSPPNLMRALGWNSGHQSYVPSHLFSLTSCIMTELLSRSPSFTPQCKAKYFFQHYS